MGTGSHSKLAAPKLPLRPFDPNKKKSCFQENLLPSHHHYHSSNHNRDFSSSRKVSTKPTTLQQLILRQDWQRVLIRVNLFPKELQIPFRIHIFGIDLDVLPLHLVCALDPPSAVVALLLKHFVDASAMAVRPSGPPSHHVWSNHGKRVFNMRGKIQHKLRRWRENRKGSFPSLEDSAGQGTSDEQDLYDGEDADASVEQRRCLLPQGQPALLGAESGNYEPPQSNFYCSDASSLSTNDPSSSLQDNSQLDDDDDDDEEEDDSMKKNGVVLQLSPSGGLAAMPIHGPRETESTSDASESDQLFATSSSVLSKQHERASTNDNSSTSADTPEPILPSSPSGGLDPMTANASKDTDSTSGVSDKTDDEGLFCVEWDFKPLLREVSLYGSLLPIHIACLFEASAQVIDHLIRAYPIGASTNVLGMLPIHLVSAGWILPPISELPPETTLVIPFEVDKPGPVESLRILYQSDTDAAEKRSAKHAMSPLEYIEECMKDGEYKDRCIQILSDKGCDTCGGLINNPQADLDVMLAAKCEFNTPDNKDDVSWNNDEKANAPSLPLAPHESMVAGLRDLIVNQDWTRALAVVEDDPATAQKWYYGVDEGIAHPFIWKRLPVHMACIHNAPIGLIDILLQLYPIGAAVEDPHDGSLPLYQLCRARAALPVVKLLLTACPDATKALDMNGRSALHAAVIYGAPLEVVQYLLEMDPETVVVADQNGMNPLDYAMEGDDMAGTELLTMVLQALENQSEP
ncbi:hypothetical protein ACA910_008905 [Epithemia clementina (nom. ined.)]